jgi:aspartate/methionine/tyrosine aminotransferase
VSLAASYGRLGTETAFSVLARAKELERAGASVIHLEIGEPDFETPQHIVDAAVEGLAAGMTHYCPSAGTAEFREAVAAYFRRSRDIDVGAERCLVGNGAKPFLFFTVLALCAEGDEVIYPDPGFPIYESAIRFSGATPVPLPLLESDDFMLDADRLSGLLTPRTKLVILNAPQNPTGGALEPVVVEALARVLEESSAFVLADEVYAQLQYDAPFRSVASLGSLADRTVVLDGLSKSYAMTGWRCGFAAVPSELVEPLTRFFVNTTSCVPPFIQHAGVAALEGPQDSVGEMRREFTRRRQLIVDGLNALPDVTCRMPAGAFYAFPNVSTLPLSSDELAGCLLEEAGVATLSGTAFGSNGEGYLRLSYANSEANIREALSRMEAFISKLQASSLRTRGTTSVP